MFFLDALHEDLNKAIYSEKRVYEECLPKGPNESDISASKRFWNFYKERNNSVIVDLFHGQLKSTIQCLVCQNEDIRFEPFVTLPLAIPILQKVELIFVPSINIKSTIRITVYISEAALFFDIENYINKYMVTKMNKFRVLLVTGTTCKFVKQSDNIYNSSKKGFIFVHEIDDRVDESDSFYPFICLIREVGNTLTAFQNFSYPRIFAIDDGDNVKQLRVNIYGFMRKYYRIVNSKFDDLEKNYQETNYLDPQEYEDVITEEYNALFDKSSNLIPEKTEYLKNLSYSVSLVSYKDENNTKLILSSNFDEFSKIFEDKQKIESLVSITKSGFKLVIEVKNEALKVPMNTVLTIDNKNADNLKVPTLRDCFDHFSLIEKLEKGNEFYCSHCKKSQNATKRLKLFYVPKNFIILIKRYDTKMLGKNKIQLLKNSQLVQYPINGLNLSDYCLGPKTPKPVYDLFAVSQHSGSIEGGHQATACRNFGKWHEIDDMTVFPSEDDLVVSPEGYILFYRRSEKNN